MPGNTVRYRAGPWWRGHVRWPRTRCLARLDTSRAVPRTETKVLRVLVGIWPLPGLSTFHSPSSTKTPEGGVPHGPPWQLAIAVAWIRGSLEAVRRYSLRVESSACMGPRRVMARTVCTLYALCRLSAATARYEGRPCSVQHPHHVTASLDHCCCREKMRPWCRVDAAISQAAGCRTCATHRTVDSACLP